MRLRVKWKPYDAWGLSRGTGRGNPALLCPAGWADAARIGTSSALPADVPGARLRLSRTQAGASAAGQSASQAGRFYFSLPSHF